MSYMVAKHFNQRGSVALERQTGLAVSDATYMRALSREWLDKDIQIVTVGNFEAHAEYKPVTYVTNRDEFEVKIAEMTKGKSSN